MAAAAMTAMTARCGALILAAGQARRMGFNKLTAPLGGKPLVTHVADAIATAGLPAPIVVLGHAAPEVRVAFGIREARFVMADRYAEGMAQSLSAGIRAVPPEWESAIICLGDMPLIAPDLLKRLAAASDRTAISIPTFNGRRGNPVLWGRDYFAEIKALTGDAGAKSLLSEHTERVIEIAWTDESIHVDVDTPQRLELLENATYSKESANKGSTPMTMKADL